MQYTIEAAARSNLTDIIVTTDLEFHVCSQRLKLDKRPKHLCLDDTMMIDVLKYIVYEYNNYDAICLLQPTSPLRTYKDINKAIELFKNSNANSLYSGYYMNIKTKDKVFDKHNSKLHFQRNGAIFIAKTELIKQGKLWDDTVIEYEMSKYRSIDIDTMEDMEEAERILACDYLRGCE